jgi:hypothetical protein
VLPPLLVTPPLLVLPSELVVPPDALLVPPVAEVPPEPPWPVLPPLLPVPEAGLPLLEQAGNTRIPNKTTAARISPHGPVMVPTIAMA